ncbi:hypothetical protein GXP67_33305 [Rhodocytophaga rosea]|uniref:Uncharacterized protein n=1 Tax=Rhodocytophaga rosea TaxID=2704465 RepID=A0A6C0GT37_9BACT|nr:hypothetical protein [Rhodocytophaga rosea]QHT71186.1 hypothetical protein GXP67_33305 [Rhodocytophaga rosea]
MENTLDQFILNLFRTEKPILSNIDFDDDNVFVCDVLDHSVDLAKDFIKHKLNKCTNRMEKMQFLYSSRECFRSAINVNEYYLEENDNNDIDKQQIRDTIKRNKIALTMAERAICFYDNCMTLDCKEKKQQSFENYTNSQIVLIFYYFFKSNGLEPRKNIDVSPIAKFLHLIIGKEFTEITNSDFYNKLRKVPNFKTDKELIKDLEIIKPLFQMVQLNEIVGMIDNEIDIAHNEKKKSKEK